MPARISGSGRPRASSTPTWRLRLRLPGAGQHEIAETAQARERLPPAARRAGQPRHLGQAARDQRRQRVVSETETFDHAGGNRDDVLQRPADLDADDVGAAVEPEVRAAKLRLHELGRRRGSATPRAPPSAAAARPRRRSSVRTTRPRVAWPRASCAITSDMRSSVPLSRPFVALTIGALGGDVRRGARMTARQPCDGMAETTRSAPRQRVRRAMCVGDRPRPGASRPADRRHWRGARACRAPAPDRAPTTGPRDRPAPDARRAPCPSCPRRERRRSRTHARAAQPGARCRSTTRSAGSTGV